MTKNSARKSKIHKEFKFAKIAKNNKKSLLSGAIEKKIERHCGRFCGDIHINSAISNLKIVIYWEECSL